MKQIPEKKIELIENIIDKISKTFQRTSAINQRVRSGLAKLTMQELDSLHVMLMTAIKHIADPSSEKEDLIQTWCAECKTFRNHTTQEHRRLKKQCLY